MGVKWEKEIKRQARGHPDNIRRILQLIKGRGTKIKDGERYVLVPEERENGRRI